MGCCVQTISSRLGEGRHSGLPDFLGGLPWLLVRFKAALKRIRSAEPTKPGQRGEKKPAALAEFAFFALLLQPITDPLVMASQVLPPIIRHLTLWPQIWQAASLYAPSRPYPIDLHPAA